MFVDGQNTVIVGLNGSRSSKSFNLFCSCLIQDFSLCSPAWPTTHYVAQIQTHDPPASASRLFGIGSVHSPQVCF